MLEDIGALQWKLEPPLEGEEKDEVDIKEMLSEIDSFAQRIEDLAVEVRDQDSFKQQLSFPVKIMKKLGVEFHAGKTAD